MPRESEHPLTPRHTTRGPALVLLTALAALMPGLASAQLIEDGWEPRETSRTCGRTASGRSDRGGACAKDIPTYLEFAPASGAGLPVVEDLCSALAAEVPNWSTPVDGGVGSLCFGGEGTAASGSIPITLRNEGSPGSPPAPADFTICPNGPDCAVKRGVSLNNPAGGTVQSIDATAQYGDSTSFFACAHYFNFYTASYSTVFQNGTPAAGAITPRSKLYGYAPLGGISFSVFSDTGTEYSSSVAGFDMYEKPVFVCGAYQRVGDGSARTALWLNGARVDTDNAAPIVLRAVTTATFGRDFQSSTAYALHGVLFGGTIVETTSTIEQLDAPIAAIARRVLADSPKAIINGKTQLPMTYTRTGSRFCSKADNTGSIVSANRPCVSQSGYLAEATATNLALRSQEFDNAAWEKQTGGPSSSLPVITANYTVAPDSTKTGERVQFSACSTALSSSIINTPNASPISAPAGTITSSFYARATAGGVSADGGVFGLFPYVGAAGQAAVYCTVPKLSGDGTAAIDGGSPWIRCSAPATVAAPSNFYVHVGCANSPGTYAGAYNSGAADVILWGAQVETGSVATSYVPTTSASAARGTDVGYFTHGQSTHATGCMATSQEWIAPRTACGGTVALTGLGAHQQSLIFCPNLNAYVAQSLKISVTPPAQTGTSRYVFSWSPQSTALTLNGTTTTGAGGTAATTDALYIGRYQGGANVEQPGRYSKVQYDPRPSRCR